MQSSDRTVEGATPPLQRRTRVAAYAFASGFSEPATSPRLDSAIRRRVRSVPTPLLPLASIGGGCSGFRRGSTVRCTGALIAAHLSLCLRRLLLEKTRVSVSLWQLWELRSCGPLPGLLRSRDDAHLARALSP